MLYLKTTMNSTKTVLNTVSYFNIDQKTANLQLFVPRLIKTLSRIKVEEEEDISQTVSIATKFIELRPDLFSDPDILQYLTRTADINIKSDICAVDILMLLVKAAIVSDDLPKSSKLLEHLRQIIRSTLKPARSAQNDEYRFYSILQRYENFAPLEKRNQKKIREHNKFFTDLILERWCNPENKYQMLRDALDQFGDIEIFVRTSIEKRRSQPEYTDFYNKVEERILQIVTCVSNLDIQADTMDSLFCNNRRKFVKAINKLNDFRHANNSYIQLRDAADFFYKYKETIGSIGVVIKLVEESSLQLDNQNELQTFLMIDKSVKLIEINQRWKQLELEKIRSFERLNKSKVFSIVIKERLKLFSEAPNIKRITVS